MKTREFFILGMPFWDVNREHWFWDDVEYVSDRNLMKGVTRRRFLPYGKVTLAVVTAALHSLSRQAGLFETSGFGLVGAVEWAADMGLKDDFCRESRNPFRSVSRQELSVILYRYAWSIHKAGEVWVNLSVFADVCMVEDWAMDAMQWAVAMGLFLGRSQICLAPHKTVTRAEFAAVLHRFCEHIGC